MSDTFIKSYCGLIDLYLRPGDLGYMLSFENLLVNGADYYGFDTIEAAEQALGWIVPPLLEDWHRLPETCPNLPCRVVFENMIMLDPVYGHQPYEQQRAVLKEQLDELLTYLNNR